MAEPLGDDIERDFPDHQPVPRRNVPQAVSARAPLPGAWRFLVEARPPNAVSDVPQRSPHADGDHLKAE